MSEIVANYCRTYLFPRFKFLKDKWDVFDPEHPKSLSNFFKKQIKIPERADNPDIWERVICPSIRLKYTNLRCNINSDVRNAYKSEYCEAVFVIIYYLLTNTLQLILYCIGDPHRDNIDPDLLMQGAETYIKESRLHELFDFLGR